MMKVKGLGKKRKENLRHRQPYGDYRRKGRGRRVEEDGDGRKLDLGVVNTIYKWCITQLHTGTYVISLASHSSKFNEDTVLIR